MKNKGLPTTALFTPDGREASRVTGIAEWDGAAAIDFIRSCLAH